jgi:hypothetical protein
MKRNSLIIAAILCVICATLVFKSLIFSHSLAHGDAPFFYPEALRELVSEPYAWSARADSLGGVNQLIWISPLMILYGLLHVVFGLSNDNILRVIFYFPSIIGSTTGAYFLAKQNKYSKYVAIFASCFVVVNTYFILLIDGGQVGVALAYAIFPWAIITLRSLVNKFSSNKLLLTILACIILAIADPRVLILSFVTNFLWLALERRINRRTLSYFGILMITTLIFSFYWIIPIKNIGTPEISTEPASLQLTSLLNGILVYQPHWSGNEFGKVTQPPFYFVLIPLILLTIFWKRERRNAILFMMFLVFVFLIKGETSPFGGIYSLVIHKIPLGSMFRDSTKFFIPVTFLVGILLGRSVEVLSKKFGTVILFVAIGLLFIFVHSAVEGKMHFVLSEQPVALDYSTIYEHLKTGNIFFRTAWMPQAAPQAYLTQINPALDAKSLVEKRPLAYLNAGEDVFNYVNYKGFARWFELLGIKYIFVDKNPRVYQESEEEKKASEELTKKLKENEAFTQIYWGQKMNVFETKRVLPHIWGVNRVIAVIGGESVYQKADDLPGEFDLAGQAFLFFEDGIFNPLDLENKASESAILVMNDKTKEDLTMSFLQKYFVSPNDASSLQWSKGEPSQYLHWKYELLIRNTRVNDLFYNRSIAFSTQANESIKFSLPVTADGKYVLAVRAISHLSDKPLDITLDFSTYQAKRFDDDNFHWSIFDSLSLSQGTHSLEITNKGGLKVINIVALIPLADWNSATHLEDVYTKQFKTYNINNKEDKVTLGNLFDSLKPVFDQYTFINPTQYQITSTPGVFWAVFTDSYHSLWSLQKGAKNFSSLPFYGMVNGFYIDSTQEDGKIVFTGQQSVRLGIYLSLIGILGISIVFLYKYFIKK